MATRKWKWIGLLFAICICSACSSEQGANQTGSPQAINVAAEESSEAELLPEPQITARRLDNVNVVLSWNAVEQADGYMIYRAEEAAGPYITIGFVTSDTHELTDKYLETDKTYYYRAQAYQEEGTERVYGVMGAAVSVTLPAYEGYFHDEDGALYCYQDNQLVRDEEIGYLYFDETGRYTSGDEELDQYLRSVTAECTDESMTQIDQFHAVYDWVIENCSYVAMQYLEAGSKGWEPELALYMFENLEGNCYYYAAIVAMLGRNVGMQAYGVMGQCYQTYMWVAHGWCEVEYEGQEYLVDAEMEGVFAAELGWEWDQFMREYGTTVNTYEKYEGY